MVVVVNGDIGHVVVIVNIAAIKVVAVGNDVVVIVAGEIGNVDGVLVVVIIVIVAFVTVVIVVIIIIVIIIIITSCFRRLTRARPDSGRTRPR